jgi:isocitrate lyase
MLWGETSEPNLEEAREFAQAIHARFPGKLLAYNCSHLLPLEEENSTTTRSQLSAGIGRHGLQVSSSLRSPAFTPQPQYVFAGAGIRRHGMSAYAKLQEREFEMSREHGYSAVRHQRFVGTGYFDDIQHVIAGGDSSTAALAGPPRTNRFNVVPNGGLHQSVRV